MVKLLLLTMFALSVFRNFGTAYADLPPEEDTARRLFQSIPITLNGSVKDQSGNPVAGASVNTDKYMSLTDLGGKFEISGLERRNILLRVEASGFRSTVVPVYLHRPAGVLWVQLDAIILVPHDESVVRFLFAGDTSFGRRFVNPEATSMVDDPDRYSLPDDHPDALIKVSDGRIY